MNFASRIWHRLQATSHFSNTDSIAGSSSALSATVVPAAKRAIVIEYGVMTIRVMFNSIREWSHGFRRSTAFLADVDGPESGKCRSAFAARISRILPPATLPEQADFGVSVSVVVAGVSGSSVPACR
jgi:hypothetical protein